MLHGSRQTQGRQGITTRQHKVKAQEAENAEQQSLIAAPKPNLEQIYGVDPFGSSTIKLEPYMHDLLKYCMCIAESMQRCLQGSPTY